MSRNAALSAVARSLVAAVRSEQLPFLAASLAYYGFVSTLPLLLLVLVVGSALGGEAFAARVLGQLGAVLSPTGEAVLRDALTGASGRGGATLLGVAVLLWSGLKFFRGLDVAFAQVYGTTGTASFAQQVRDAVVTLVAVGVGVVAVVAIGAVLGRADLPVLDLLGTPGLTLALTVTFLPLYVLLPNQPVRVREALPGAVLAAGGWTVLSTAFRVYAEAAGTFRLYGVVGGVLLLVTWFYLGSIVLLLGAVLNAVLAGRGAPDRQLQQEPTPRLPQPMTDEGEAGPPGKGAAEAGTTEPGGPVEDDLAALRARIEAIEDRTVHREDLERDLRRYVRRRVRRGHATGWGPYLVLLYGTVMTLGAFSLLSGGWAILAMLVVWLSTLGLYVLMVVLGLTAAVAGLPGRLRDAVGDRRG